MGANPPSQGRLRGALEWAKGVIRELRTLKPPEKTAVVVAGLILTAIIYENIHILIAYKPSLETWAVIFDGDMTAGLVITAVVAVGFEFWKSRKPPETKPQSLTVRLYLGDKEVGVNRSDRDGD